MSSRINLLNTRATDIISAATERELPGRTAGINALEHLISIIILAVQQEELLRRLAGRSLPIQQENIMDGSTLIRREIITRTR